MTGTGTRVQAVAAEATYALRQRVLRPRLSLAEMAMPGDEDPATVYLAIQDDGQVVCTLRLQPVPCPWTEGADAAWQLRGMATAPDYRGRGLGSELVTAAVDRVAEHGGNLLWCKARVPAQKFYNKAGFVAVTTPWEEPGHGPHIGMLRRASP